MWHGTLHYDKRTLDNKSSKNNRSITIKISKKEIYYETVTKNKRMASRNIQ